jgi:hypothetical protein
VDDDQPMGTVEISQLIGIPVAVVSQWHRRGHLAPARWTVSGRPAWSYADVLAMLADVSLHAWDGKWERCGSRSCTYCSAGHPSVPASSLVGFGMPA